MSQFVPITVPLPLPVLIAAAGDHAGLRFLEFFASTIRNPHTRRAYAHAVTDFLAWCEAFGVPSIAAVQPLHVASWIEGQTRECSAPTVKPHIYRDRAATRQFRCPCRSKFAAARGRQFGHLCQMIDKRLPVGPIRIPRRMREIHLYLQSNKGYIATSNSQSCRRKKHLG